MKILASDDHALIRAGLHSVLRELGDDLDFIEACDGASTRSMLSKHPDIDLLLLDVRLPDCDGISLLTELQKEYPALPVIMLSAESDAVTVSKAIDSGAAGFLPKTSLNMVLIPALRLVMAGGIYVPPDVLRQETAVQPRTTTVANQPEDAPELRSLGLTGRQNEVLALLLEGKSNKQICRELDLAEATVKVHVRAILRALDANSRTEAVVAFTKRGFKVEDLQCSQHEALSRSRHSTLRFRPP